VAVSAAFQEQSGTFWLTNAATALVNGQQAQHTQFFSIWPAILLLHTVHPLLVQQSQATAGVAKVQQS